MNQKNNSNEHSYQSETFYRISNSEQVAIGEKAISLSIYATEDTWESCIRDTQKKIAHDRGIFSGLYLTSIDIILSYDKLPPKIKPFFYSVKTNIRLDIPWKGSFSFLEKDSLDSFVQKMESDVGKLNKVKLDSENRNRLIDSKVLNLFIKIREAAESGLSLTELSNKTYQEIIGIEYSKNFSYDYFNYENPQTIELEKLDDSYKIFSLNTLLSGFVTRNTRFPFALNSIINEPLLKRYGNNADLQWIQNKIQSEKNNNKIKNQTIISTTKESGFISRLFQKFIEKLTKT